MAHNQDAASQSPDRKTRMLAPDAEGIALAAALLRAGKLVAFPTETVYGLGADARDDAAVAGIYAAKARPSFNPLIVHLPDLDAVRTIAQVGPAAEALAAAFWPGPLTLVLPLTPASGLSRLVTAGLETVAVRVPAAPLAQELLRAAAIPVAAPSANPSGRISPTHAAHVMQGLEGRIDAVLDGGACAVGVESTILDVTGPPMLLRPGGLPAEVLEAALGAPLARLPDHQPDRPSAPGQLTSHYAPNARLRLNAQAPRTGETLLGFGPVEGAVLNLSRNADLVEATANLFAMLHKLDTPEVTTIAVSPIPDHGLGTAINDRLTRAAAPRA